MNVIRRLCSVYAEGSAEIHIFSGNLSPAASHRQQHFEALEMLSAVCAEYYREKYLRIRRDGNGKPQLIHPFLHMNLAHCKGLAVCAVGNVPMGVDAEPPRSVRNSVIARICSARECAMLAESDAKEQLFSRLWTLKEAYGKWQGGGIRLPLSSLSFSLSDHSIVFEHPDAEKLSFFQMILENPKNPPIAVSLCCENIGHPYQIESTVDVLTSVPSNRTDI